MVFLENKLCAVSLYVKYPQTFLRLLGVIIMQNVPALCAQGHIEKEETKGRDAILEGSLSCLNVLLVHLCVHTLWFQRVC